MPVSSFLPTSWSYRMINKIFVHLWQSQNYFKAKTTQGMSHLPVEVAAEALDDRHFSKDPRIPIFSLPSRKPPSLSLMSVSLFCF